MNNVETSKKAISKLCPELITYFSSGSRTSIFDLALLHAAARCERVYLRGSDIVGFARRPGEDVASFYKRLVQGDADEPSAQSPHSDGPPVFAILYRGDLELPGNSAVYALFHNQITPSLAASDLLS
jgi:hypothetical protein